jgi:glycosyltransferase involved in cell wall biosynthesis
MKPLRIAVEGLYATEGTTDGGGRFLTSLLTALGRRDDVEIVALVGPSTHDDVAKIDGLAETVLVDAETRGARLAAQHVRLPRIARAHGADVLLCLGNYAPLAPGIPVVTVVQNLLLAISRPEYGRLRALYRRGSARFLARRCERIVAISETMRAELERSTPSTRGHVDVVPPGVDLDYFGAPSSRPIGAPEHYLLAVGTVWNYRDYPLALAALADSGLPHELVIAGPADAEARAGLESRARELGLNGRLRLLGAVSPEDMRSWFAGADALVATSQMESWGLSVLEAMAVGTPVVAAARTVYPETVGDGGLLVEPEAAALGAALARAVDPAERAALIAAGRERAAQFTWDRCAQGMVQVCRTASAG